MIDMAKTRRGRPSINVVWGNHTSVLAGDWLHMQAFQVALRERSFPILDTLINLTQMMVEGELLQLERIGKIAVTEADYMELIDRKTASLFSACARLGAAAQGAEERQELRKANTRGTLGIAFQLIDDKLDFTSREKILGILVGKHHRYGLVTLPLIDEPEAAIRGSASWQEYRWCWSTGNYDQVPFGKILHILRRYNGIELIPVAARGVHGEGSGDCERVPAIAVSESAVSRHRDGDRPGSLRV